MNVVFVIFGLLAVIGGVVATLVTHRKKLVGGDTDRPYAIRIRLFL